MSVVPNDLIEVVARLNWAGLVAFQNRFHVKFTGATPITDVNAADDLADWMNDLYTSINAYIWDNIAYGDIAWRDITQGTPLALEPWPVLTVGGSASDPVAFGVSLVLTTYTAFKRIRGRKFFPIFGEGSMTGGFYLGGVLTAAAAALVIWMTPFTGVASGLGWTPGVIDQSNVFHDFILGRVRNVPGYQRRRKPGVGA